MAGRFGADLRSVGLGLAAMAAWLAPTPAAAETVFRLGIPADAVTLDPIGSSDTPSVSAQRLVYGTLVRPARNGTDIEPDLAEKWTVSPDGREYVFTLRDAKFADGSPVTANDVAFSLRRAAAEKSDWARFFGSVADIEAVDVRTVRIALNEPFTPLLSSLALAASAVLPAALVQNDPLGFFDHPIGSGPFVLKEWKKGERMVLAKNSGYWQAGKPALDTVAVLVVADDDLRAAKLQAAELDAAISIPPSGLARLAIDPEIRTGLAEIHRVELVQLNTKKPPLDDARVRQALNYAIDKQAIIARVLLGNGQPAATPIPGMRYGNATLRPYPHDPDKAKTLLGDAGLAGGFAASLIFPSGNAVYRAVASMIRDDLAGIGVTVELHEMTAAEQFAATRSGAFDMALGYAAASSVDPDEIVGLTAVTPERANALDTQWLDVRVNELYELERRTPDGPDRAAQFGELEARVHDGAPFIFLYRQPAPFAYRANVEGFTILPTSDWRLEDVVVR